MAFVFPLIVVAMLYVMVVLPQRKRLQAQREMLSAIGPGDRVVTIGGIHGTVVGEDGEVFVIEVGPGINLNISRSAIARRVIEAALSEPDHDGPGELADHNGDEA